MKNKDWLPFLWTTHLVVSTALLFLSFWNERFTRFWVLSWACLWVLASMVWFAVEQRQKRLLAKTRTPLLLSIINTILLYLVTPGVAMVMALLYSPMLVMGPLVVFFLSMVVSAALVMRRSVGAETVQVTLDEDEANNHVQHE